MANIIKCCKYCTKRYVGCHSKCSDYISESKERAELINRERETKKLNNFRNASTKSVRNKWNDYRKDSSRRNNI